MEWAQGEAAPPRPPPSTTPVCGGITNTCELAESIRGPDRGRGLGGGGGGARSAR